jgi:DNA-binding CsgD family transcriptional regulator
MLLDERGRIVATNREADRVLRQNDGLSSSSHGIIASRQNNSQELHAMIAGAAKTAEGEDTKAGGLLALPRPSGKRSLTVLVAPVRRNFFTTDVKAPLVILIVTDPENKAENLVGALARLYDLTAAESRVAELLMQGETVVRAAERLGVTHNTARTHLQRIYQKTNTSHQGDLIRVLLSVTLPMH